MLAFGKQSKKKMNAVEFLISHRVVVNKHDRQTVLRQLTENIKQTLARTQTGVRHGSLHWRREEKRRSTALTSSGVEFDKQLDKMSIWLDSWSHPQKCRFLEELLRHSSYKHLQQLHTVLQPALHRDFMYTARSRFPDIDFAPTSTHVTRKLKDNLTRLRLVNFHRVSSAYVQKENDLERIKFPHLQQATSYTTQSMPEAISTWSGRKYLRRRRETQTREALRRWIGNNTTQNGQGSVTQNATAGFMKISVRRHIQNEQMNHEKKFRKTSTTSKMGPKSVLFENTQSAPTCRSKRDSERYDSLPKSDIKLTEQGRQIIQWYTQEWNDAKKNEFLHNLLLKLDPRQHYFISSYLSLKHHRDIVGMLPEKLSLKIFKYLTPKELLVASKVSKKWEHLANNNKLWEEKCKEVTLNVPVPANPNWKNVYQNNLYLRLNWNKGSFRTIDFYGHKQSVLCVTCDMEFLASGSSDKTIKVWDIKTGQLLRTLRGHKKGVWCLQFFTKFILVSGSFDCTIRIWNLRTGATFQTLLGHNGQIWCMKGQGSLIVSGSQDRTAKIWNIGRCVLLHTLSGHSGAVFSVDMSENGDVVITGSADKSVRLWTTANGQLIKIIWVSSTTSVMSVSYSHGYFACSFNNAVCLYKGEELIRTFIEHSKRVETVKLQMVDTDNEEGYIVSSGKDGLIKYWDIRREKSIQTFIGHNQPITCIYADLLRFVSASRDNTIKLWDFNIGMPHEEEKDENK